MAHTTGFKAERLTAGPMIRSDSRSAVRRASEAVPSDPSATGAESPSRTGVDSPLGNRGGLGSNEWSRPTADRTRSSPTDGLLRNIPPNR